MLGAKRTDRGHPAQDEAQPGRAGSPRIRDCHYRTSGNISPMCILARRTQDEGSEVRKHRGWQKPSSQRKELLGPGGSASKPREYGSARIMKDETISRGLLRGSVRRSAFWKRLGWLRRPENIGAVLDSEATRAAPPAPAGSNAISLFIRGGARRHLR